MKLTFIGADHEVTGSCHVVEAAGRTVLVDFGMRQGAKVFEQAPLPVAAEKIDAVLLTHAHVDHSGMLPKLYVDGYRGPIYTTKASADLCSIMLRDCAHIQFQEAEWKKRKAKRGVPAEAYEPPYDMEHTQMAIRHLESIPYGEISEILPGIRIRFTDVGHLLGSASIEMWVKEGEVEKKLVFSGDIGNRDQPLIKNPMYTRSGDYVVMESTYGNRLHTELKIDSASELAEVIRTTFDRGGNVVIPSFAVGRTQEILYHIRRIKAEGMVKNHGNFPVYVDSPLAVEATGVFQKNIAECFDEEAMALVNKGINPIAFPGLHLAITPDESKAINTDDEPKVIISASGMCEAGRIRHHLKYNLWRPESTILFVGYQAVGTLGRSIIEGAEFVKLFGEVVDVKAEIRQLPGLSGHADKNGLLKWIGAFEEKPERVFVVHGDNDACADFTECLKKEQGFNAYAPYSGTVFDLLENRFVYEAEPVPAKKPAKKSAGTVFARLLAAGEKLLALIRRSEGRPNKELAKFAEQVENLSRKWSD